MALQALVMPLVSIFRSTGFKEAIKAVNGLDGEFKKVAQSAGLAAGSFAASAVLQKVTQYIDEAVVATQKYERNMLALNQVFGSQMGVMRQFTKDAQDMGISQGQAAQAGVFLGSVLKQYGLSAEQTTSETQKLITLSQDLATTYGYDLQEALLAMTALFRGEYDPIEKFGVAMKQNEINALLAARNQDKLTGTMLFQAQVQARLDLLYQRSADSMGAYERAQGTLYVAQQNLNAAMENQQIAFGEGLQGPLATVTDLFARLIVATTPLADALGQALGAVIELLGSALTKIADGVGAIVGGLGTATQALIDFSNAVNDAVSVDVVDKKMDDRARQIAALEQTIYQLEQKVKQGGLGWQQYQHEIDAARAQINILENATYDADTELKRFQAQAERTRISLEEAAAATTYMQEELMRLGIYAVDADGKLSGLALLFTEIDEAARQSEASDALLEIGFSAGQIEQILTRPDWAQIFNEISTLAAAAAREITAAFGTGAYWVQMADKGAAEAALKALFEGLKESGNVKKSTGAAATDVVKDFYNKLDDEVAKQSARTKLTKMGASAGLIDQILGGAGWEKVYNDILKGGSKSLKELQKQFNKTKDGIDEVTQAQKDAYDAAVDAGKAAYEARKALEDEASAWKTLTDAVDEFKSSISNVAVSSILPTDAKEFGQFESAVVDGLAQIKDSLKSAFDNGYIYEQAYRDLQAYAEKEFALLQANARQRDALAAKYSFVKNLLADYRSAFTSALNLTSLIQSIDNKTKEITVTEVTSGITSVSESLKNFRTTVTRSWTETINETANTASGLVDKFRTVADKTRVFADNLKKLKELGLDPQLFNQLVQAGVEAGGETAQALIDGGAATIQELNGIFKDIADAGVKAGELVATDLYNTGSDFASSLLDGIKSQQTAFEKAAETLAGAFKDQFNLDVGTATDAVLSDLQSSLDALNAEKRRIEGRLQEENLILTGGKAGPGARAAAQTKITSYTAQLQAVVDQIANLQAQISSAKIPALASGGIALDSALAMVGEAGPEAIIPLSKLGAVTGGGTTNITINVTADTRAGGIAAGEAIIGALKTYAQAGGPVSNLLGAAQVTL